MIEKKELSRQICWFYDEDYNYGRGLFLDDIHGFALKKAHKIREFIIKNDPIYKDSFTAPKALTNLDFFRVHLPSFLAKLTEPRKVAEAIEFPAIRWLSEELVKQAIVAPQFIAAAGTYQALLAASEGAWAFNLSGGFHHAHKKKSHGFCLINDVAIAIEKLRSIGQNPKILILDLDLHQGDGNAVIFRNDPNVFTVSMHEEAIFPFPKAKSDLDIGLQSNLHSKAYLQSLDKLLSQLPRLFNPDIVIYLAGTDIYKQDPLGSLQLSKEAIITRDKKVAKYVKKQAVAEHITAQRAARRLNAHNIARHINAQSFNAAKHITNYMHGHHFTRKIRSHRLLRKIRANHVIRYLRAQRIARYYNRMSVGLVVLPAGGYNKESASLSGAGFAAIAKIGTEN